MNELPQRPAYKIGDKVLVEATVLNVRFDGMLEVKSGMDWFQIPPSAVRPYPSVNLEPSRN